MAQDYYSILGVDRKASDDEIKRAYRRLAQKFHPDRNSDNKESEKKFKEINMAYEILSDKEKRQNYDQFGESGVHFDTSGFTGQGFDFSDFSTGFGDIFETFFGAGGRSRSRRRESTRGSDIETILRISLQESAFGCEKDLKVTKAAICDRCKGSGNEPGSRILSCSICSGTGEIRAVRTTFLGQIATSQICDTCQGAGKVPEKKCSQCHGATRVRSTEVIRVKIPEGIDTGATIRLSDKGEGGLRGGTPGDLYIRIQVDPSPEFTRRGYDVYSEKTIHMLQAVLGDEIEVNTLHGKLRLRIPSGTQSGSLFKLDGKGIKRLRGHKGQGDHFVRILVEIPKKLSKKEREMYSELAETSGLSPKGKDGFFHKMGL